MNPLSPVSDLFRAVFFPIKALFVVAICFVVNVVTSPHHWWFQWVAFGMGIATLVIWLRALRTILATAGVAGLGYLGYRWWTKRTHARRDGVTYMQS